MTEVTERPALGKLDGEGRALLFTEARTANTFATAQPAANRTPVTQARRNRPKRAWCACREISARGIRSVITVMAGTSGWFVTDRYRCDLRRKRDLATRR